MKSHERGDYTERGGRFMAWKRHGEVPRDERWLAAVTTSRTEGARGRSPVRMRTMEKGLNGGKYQKGYMGAGREEGRNHTMLPPPTSLLLAGASHCWTQKSCSRKPRGAISRDQPPGAESWAQKGWEWIWELRGGDREGLAFPFLSTPYSGTQVLVLKLRGCLSLDWLLQDPSPLSPWCLG